MLVFFCAEVLRRRQKYLPMFNEPDWEEVFVTDKGTMTPQT
jgi:hypothetical protein